MREREPANERHIEEWYIERTIRRLTDAIYRKGNALSQQSTLTVNAWTKPEHLPGIQGNLRTLGGLLGVVEKLVADHVLLWYKCFLMILPLYGGHWGGKNEASCWNCIGLIDIFNRLISEHLKVIVEGWNRCKGVSFGESNFALFSCRFWMILVV